MKHCALLLAALTACGSPDRVTIESAATSASTNAGHAPSAAKSSVVSSASASSPASSASVAVSEPPPAKQAKTGFCEADGLSAKGTVRVSRVDLHGYARLLADVFRKDIVVAGELADPKGQRCPGACLDFEERVTTLEEALAPTGARVTMRRGAALVGEQVKPAASPVLGPSRAVDFHMQRGSSSKIAEILGDVAKRKVDGAPEGEVTLVLRERPALDALALLADVAGTTVRTEGNKITFALGGSLPALTPEVPTVKKAEGRPLREVIAGDEPLESLRVAALVRGPNGTARALITTRASGGFGWVVHNGDFVGKEMQLVGKDFTVMVNARVERIHCLGVSLVIENVDPTGPVNRHELYLD